MESFPSVVEHRHSYFVEHILLVFVQRSFQWVSVPISFCAEAVMTPERKIESELFFLASVVDISDGSHSIRHGDT